MGSDPPSRLLDRRVVAVQVQRLTHRLGVAPAYERPHIQVKQCVLRSAIDRNIVAASLQRAYHRVSVGPMRERHDLHHRGRCLSACMLLRGSNCIGMHHTLARCAGGRNRRLRRNRFDRRRGRPGGSGAGSRSRSRPCRSALRSLRGGARLGLCRSALLGLCRNSLAVPTILLSGELGFGGSGAGTSSPYGGRSGFNDGAAGRGFLSLPSDLSKPSLLRVGIGISGCAGSLISLSGSTTVGVTRTTSSVVE